MSSGSTRILGIEARWMVAISLLALVLMGAAEPTPLVIPSPNAGDTPKRADMKAPPGIEAQAILPHTGDKLDRAKMTLEAILASLPKPKAPATQPAPVAGESDPPLAAQMAYVAGRQAWLEGRNFEATRELEVAQRLAPRSAQIFRLLARTNGIKAAEHLSRALVLDPTDGASAFELGRIQLDQRHWSDAIVTLANAGAMQDRMQDHDPVQLALIRFYLGSALKQEGYDAAAIENLLRFLKTSDYGNLGSPLAYQLMLARRQNGLMWQTVGDAYNRLSQPAAALDAYRQAVLVGVSSEQDLVARVVYTLLWLGRVEDAQQLTVSFLGREGIAPGSFELASYLKNHGVNGQQLAQRLMPVYAQSNNSSQLAMLIAELTGPEQSMPFLRDHLSKRPNDRAVFAYLMKRQLDDKGKLTPQASAMMLDIVAQALTAATGAGTDYIESLFEAAGDPAVVQEAIAQLPPEKQQQPAIRFLSSLTMALRSDADGAQKLLEQVVADAPKLVPARVALARLYVNRGEHEKARTTLTPLADNTDSQVVMLRARALAQAGQTKEAIALLDEVLARGLDQATLIVEKARLQLQSNDGIAAERTLLDALSTHQDAEALYEALFVLYDDENAHVPDSTKQYERLMWRMLRAIPDSRLARLKLAEQYMIQPRTQASAEQLLRGLLDQNPRDWQALDNLLELLVKSDRKDESTKLLEKRLAETPRDQSLLNVAVKHYLQRLNDQTKANEYHERLLMLLPASPLRTAKLTAIYVDTGRHDDAIKLLTDLDPARPEADEIVNVVGSVLARMEKAEEMDAIFKRYIDALPKLEPHLRFVWAVAYDNRGDRPRFLTMLRENLAKFPDHVQTNNTLGYTWAYRGENLAEAKKLIERAVEAEPNNGAYLDSLGWVNYKLGNFEQAVKWLKRAADTKDGQDSIIFDHAGDALFRAGDREAAADFWQRATALYRPAQSATSADPERKDLGARLRLKINAIRTNSRPPVAPVPGIADEAGATQPAPAEAAP